MLFYVVENIKEMTVTIVIYWFFLGVYLVIVWIFISSVWYYQYIVAKT